MPHTRNTLDTTNILAQCVLTSRINKTYSVQSVVQVELVLNGAKSSCSCKNMGLGESNSVQMEEGQMQSERGCDRNIYFGLVWSDRPPNNTKISTNTSSWYQWSTFLPPHQGGPASSSAFVWRALYGWLINGYSIIRTLYAYPTLANQTVGQSLKGHISV